jgi:hypothetical protein
MARPAIKVSVCTSILLSAILNYKEQVIVTELFFPPVGRPAFLSAMKVTMTDDYVRMLGPFR